MLTNQYIAGLFDGEGFVSVVYYRNRKRESGGYRAGHIKLSIGIANTHRGVLEQVKASLGGHVSTCGGTVDRPQYVWNCGGADNQRRFVLAVQDHVVIKQKDVSLATKFLATVKKPGYRVGPEAWAVRVAIYEQFIAIHNRLGKQHKHGPPPTRVAS